MSAQKREPRGVFSAIAGLVGFSALAGLLVTVMVTPALAVTGMTASNTIGIFESLPSYISIGKQPQKNEIFSYTGLDKETGEPVGTRLLATIFKQNREEVKWEEVSDHIKNATLAAEDKRFYDHNGVDIQGVIRAAVKNATSGDIQGGGSTLSMQLVKNIFIQQAIEASPTLEAQVAAVKEAQRTTFERKLKEIKFAIGLEKNYSKDEIMLGYLNIAGFGGNTYGIEAAANRYFQVSAADVTIAQAASLMAIVQEPGARALDSPDHYEANRVRRDSILKTMYAEKMITLEERDEALATPIDETTVTLTDPKVGCVNANAYAKQFCDYIRTNVKNFEALGNTEADRQTNWDKGGYKVYTTLNLKLQEIAQKTVQQYAPNNEQRMKLGASSTSIEVDTGRILTMAQNKLFDDTAAGLKNPRASALNFNTDQPYGGSSGFQVGSTYKVFTLINWLQQGFGLNEVVNANPRTVSQTTFADSCGGPWAGPWKFRNDSGETGNWTVKAAFGQSVNGAFVTMAQQLDQCDTKKIAESLGVHTAIRVDNPKTDFVENELETRPSAILGTNDIAPMTMASAYSGIANNGKYCKPIAVDFFFGPDGTKLAGQDADCKQVLDPEVAAATQAAMKVSMARYGANPRDGIPIIGKTGTTDKSKQTYVIGTTTKVSTIVWVGNINGNYPMRSYPGGGTLRHTIGRVIMSAANQMYGGKQFPDPPSKLEMGANATPMPNFIGTSPESAQAAIEGLGMSFSNGGQVDSELPIGVVAKTSPAAGTKLARGQTVKIWVSNGSMTKVPDVVTGNPSPGDAKATLSSAGFNTVTEYCVEVEPGDTVGKVVATTPSPGQSWVRTERIQLGIGSPTC